MIVTRGIGLNNGSNTPLVTIGLGLYGAVNPTPPSNGGSGGGRILSSRKHFLDRKELDQLIEKKDVWQYATHQEKEERKSLLIELKTDISEAAQNYIAARLTLLRLELEERRRMYVLNTLLLYLYV